MIYCKHTGMVEFAAVIQCRALGAPSVLQPTPGLTAGPILWRLFEAPWGMWKQKTGGIMRDAGAPRSATVEQPL